LSNNLSDIETNELSIVGKPAIKKTFVLFKSADEPVDEEVDEEEVDSEDEEETEPKKAKKRTVDDKMTKEEIIQKSADELKIEELQKALDLKDEELKKAASSIDEVKKKEVELADLKKSAEEKEQIAKEALTRVARLEDIAKTATVKDEVKKSMGFVAGTTVDELTPVIKALDERQLTKEEIAILTKALTSSSAIIEKSLLFKELGSSRGDEPTSPIDMANAYVDGKIQKGEGAPDEDSKRVLRSEFWDAHPDIYQSYLKGGK